MYLWCSLLMHCRLQHIFIADFLNLDLNLKWFRKYSFWRQNTYIHFYFFIIIVYFVPRCINIVIPSVLANKSLKFWLIVAAIRSLATPSSGWKAQGSLKSSPPSLFPFGFVLYFEKKCSLQILPTKMFSYISAKYQSKKLQKKLLLRCQKSGFFGLNREY